MAHGRKAARAAAWLLLAGLVACGGDGDGDGKKGKKDRDGDGEGKKRDRGAALAQAPGGALGDCTVDAAEIGLPQDLAEISGLAASRKHAGVFWAHGDSGGDPVVFAVDATGALRGRVTVAGATNDDWEDIAVGPCQSGDCLYLADIGDNGDDRPTVTVWRVAEPAPGDPQTAAAERFDATYPGGARDAEALFVTGEGGVFIVTKGQNHPIDVFRFPAPMATGATLQMVRNLGPEPKQSGDRITGASASPDGRFVAVRSYASLFVYPTASITQAGTGAPAATTELLPLGEPQGEGVSLGDGGVVTLSSEGGGKKRPGRLARLTCRIPG